MAAQFSDGNFPSDTENVSSQVVDRGIEASFDVSEELDIENLSNEQLRIDSVLNYLLNFDCPKKNVGRPRKRGGKSSASTSNRENSNSQQPVLVEGVGEEMKNLTDVKEIHPGLLMDFLIKVNKFNKELLQGISILNKKCDGLAEQLRLACERAPGASERNLPTSPEQEEVSKAQGEVNDLQTRIDALEQRANASYLLCSGPCIKEAIEGPQEMLKDNVISQIKHAMPEITEEEIIKVTPFGKKKTHVKVECNSFNVKKKIISRARQLRPDNLYFCEFLTQHRNKMFYSLRSLKGKFPNKIKAVYTRDGNLFYKLRGTEDFKRIRCPKEVTELEKRLARTEE